jgi:pimeloyl-ACP methyl ester carboxylesterase
MDDTCRWVNVIIPGFDGQDERRANYTGSIQDFSQLLIMLLHHLQVSRIIYVGHSLGSILAGYFINKYPQYVRGYVNVTGIVNLWYTGLLTFYRTVVANYGFNKGPSRNSMLRLLDKD